MSDKTNALNALRKKTHEFIRIYECANLAEFKQRLQWLSEGMLKNHLTGVVSYTINMKEIELYQEYRESRDQILRDFKNL